MEQIRKILFIKVKNTHPKARDNSIKSKISYVLSNKDNKIILEQYLDKYEKLKLTNQNPNWQTILTFLQDEIELEFQKDRDIYSLNREINFDFIKGDEFTEINNEFVKKDGLIELLKNPLVLEERDPIGAFKIVLKYYNLPFFEKEAYKLRQIRKIKAKQPDLLKINKEINTTIELESIFSEFGILSLQRRAAIRIRMSWKNKIKRELEKPYSNLIDNSLNIK